MDQENTKYCSTHGIELEVNRICPKCKGQRGEFAEVLAKRNPHGRPNTDWLASYVKYKPDSFAHVSVCNDCKYYMFHSLVYCPFCGNKLHEDKLTWKEFSEKYGKYRKGY